MSFWTDEQKMRAAKLWQEGRSASEIAAGFGVSRSSVIGIAHRNRDLFPNKPVSAKTNRAPKPGRMARPFVIRKVKPAWPGVGAMLEAVAIVDMPDPSFVPSNPVTILALDSRTCRWPLWPISEHPGAAGLYCGETTDGDSAWCRHHRLAARDRSRAVA